MTVQKVKPKQLTKSFNRVTQVHGSMEAEDVISLVKSIKEQKEQRVKLKEIQMKKKEKEKEKEDSTAVKANASAKKTDALLLD